MCRDNHCHVVKAGCFSLPESPLLLDTGYETWNFTTCLFHPGKAENIS
jgi:hypothetical protein